MNYALDFAYVWNYVGPLAAGLRITLIYTAVSIAMGLMLGFVAGTARHYGGRVLSTCVSAYVELFRGTPVLVQLFWFLFCLPALLGIEVGSTVSTVATLTLYMGAISSESFRSALRGIGAEQGDASVALSLPPRVFLLHVVLPQAVLRATPNLLSNTVTLFKESALVSAMGINDLMYQSQSIAEITGRPIEILTTAALIYFVIAFGLTRAVSFAERFFMRRLAM